MLWGKSSKCVMVTKGWFRVSIGVILLSASMVSIFFNRSMNSRRSAFSTNMSLPSKSVVMFTWKQGGQVTKTPLCLFDSPYTLQLHPISQSPFSIPTGRCLPFEGTATCHCCPQDMAGLSAGKAEGGHAQGRGGRCQYVRHT